MSVTDTVLPPIGAASGSAAATSQPERHPWRADNVLTHLFERAAPSLSDDELSTVEGLAEHAGCINRDMSTLCESLYCLVSHDAGNHAEGRPSAGNFQGRADELLALLTVLGGMSRQAASLIEVSEMARSKRYVLELAARSKTTSKRGQA